MALTTYANLSVTAGTAPAKGAYTEIVASTPYASSRVVLLFHNIDTARRLALVDLATGAASSETVVVANIAIHSDADVLTGGSISFDLDIPAGTRLAARCGSAATGAVISFSLLLDSRALGSLAAPVTYGADTSLAKGTQIDPGTTINTKGSYVQFTASTSARIDALAVCVTVSLSSNVTAYTLWQVDIATGAGGAETVVVADLRIDAALNADAARPSLVRVPIAIPAGTRLAVRCQCNRNTANERVLCVTLIGLQEPASGGGSAAGAVAYVG